jgi:hypothetical protein
MDLGRMDLGRMDLGRMDLGRREVRRIDVGSATAPQTRGREPRIAVGDTPGIDPFTSDRDPAMTPFSKGRLTSNGADRYGDRPVRGPTGYPGT